MELESSRIFAKVVQQQSFSRAGVHLEMPVSTVSRAISRLERDIGTKLLHRTTRSLKLTKAGEAFYETISGPLQILEDARKSLQDSDRIVAGTVKLTASEDLGEFAVTPSIAALIPKYPELSFDVHCTDAVVDLVQQGYDIAVRVGRLNASRFRAIKVGNIEVIAVASPAYLARKLKPREPKDLAQHDLIVFGPDWSGTRFRFSTALASTQLTLTPKVRSNQMQGLVALALAGVGIALVPQYACAAAMKEKRLVRVLPGWTYSKHAVTVISPNTQALPSRVKVVMEHLANSLRGLLAPSA